MVGYRAGMGTAVLMLFLRLEGLAAPLALSGLILPCLRASGLVTLNAIDIQHLAGTTHDRPPIYQSQE